jgi:hypothetical protein
MNWKECGRKRSWPNLRYCPGDWREWLGKTVKHLNQDNRCSGQDLGRNVEDYKLNWTEQNILRGWRILIISSSSRQFVNTKHSRRDINKKYTENFGVEITYRATASNTGRRPDNVKVLRETRSEDGRRMDLVQDRISWRPLILASLKIQVLLAQNSTA